MSCRNIGSNKCGVFPERLRYGIRKEYSKVILWGERSKMSGIKVMISVNHVNRHLWKLSSVRCLNFVAPTQEPLSRPLSVQGLRFPSSTITLQPIPNKHDLFCLCFTPGRQLHTHFRTLLAGETSFSFIAFMHLCPLDLCSYAEKIAKIHDFREYKDSICRSSAWNVNIIGK